MIALLKGNRKVLACSQFRFRPRTLPNEPGGEIFRCRELSNYGAVRIDAIKLGNLVLHTSYANLGPCSGKNSYRNTVLHHTVPCRWTAYHPECYHTVRFSWFVGVVRGLPAPCVLVNSTLVSLCKVTDPLMTSYCRGVVFAAAKEK